MTHRHAPARVMPAQAGIHGFASTTRVVQMIRLITFAHSFRPSRIRIVTAVFRHQVREVSKFRLFRSA
jgi:hypothetical protein